jgi:hypothetical protein
VFHVHGQVLIEADLVGEALLCLLASASGALAALPFSL